MSQLLKNIILIVMLSYLAISTAWATKKNYDNTERNYFQFVIPKYHTARQSGQVVNIYIRYAYKKGLPESEYPDYIPLRKTVLAYMEPSKELPEQVFWEIIASRLGKQLMQDFPLDGISIQLEVLDSQNPEKYEPNDHGPTFTIGEIEPLNIQH